MKRTIKRTIIYGSSVSLLVLSVVTAVWAAELTGTVTERRDGEVKVDYAQEGKVAPAIGDTVAFSEILPEEGIPLEAGTGTVKEVGEGFVWVTVTTMDPRLKDIATIEATAGVAETGSVPPRAFFSTDHLQQRSSGKAKRGWLKATVRPMTIHEVQTKGLSSVGSVIEAMGDGESSQSTDLAVGDIILEINETPLGSMDHLLVEIASHDPGSLVELQILRDGKVFLKHVELGERLVDDAVLQYHLSNMYRRGDGVAQDFTESARLLHLSADGGFAPALYNLGRTFEVGQGVPQDPKIAAKYYRLAADQGIREAQFNLGAMYESGEGLSNDLQEAARYYQLAADQDFAPAQTELGRLYNFGLGVPQDPQKAVRYFQLAANQGDVVGQFNLARMYNDGKGVTQNFKTAAHYFQLAADQGHALAQTTLGGMYGIGQGVEANVHTAARYLGLAANQGQSLAQYSLGIMHELGEGFPQDVEEAVGWYKKAAAQGDKEAIKQLQRLGR